MKFLNFYEDLIVEARFFTDEKYEFIINNIGDMLFAALLDSPSKVSEIPEIERFKNYLKTMTTEKITSMDDVAYNITYIGDWLKTFKDSEFSKIINGIFTKFPKIKVDVNNFKKPKRDPNLPPSRRGRPPGSKSEPKPKEFTRVLSRTPIEPMDMPIGSSEKEEVPVEPTEPKSTLYLKPGETLRKRGRKPIYDGLTSMERMKFRNEGPEMIQKLEDKAEKLDKSVTDTIKRIKEIFVAIDKRKKFWGISD